MMPEVTKRWVVVDRGNGLIVGRCSGVLDQGDSGGPELELVESFAIGTVDVPVPAIQGFKMERRTTCFSLMPTRKVLDPRPIMVPLKGAMWYAYIDDAEVSELKSKFMERNVAEGGAG
jgi:hypothetical protein